MNVCILGAGASGLAAIRHVSESQMTGVVFESTEDIGGIWNYTDDTGEGIHSTAYKGLRTNLPKEIMGFLDFEMVGQNKNSFIYHEEVLAFLKSYAEKFNLYDKIQFNTRVIDVKPVNRISKNSKHSTVLNGPQWEVTISRKNGTNETFLFDAVMVCNGHFSKPQIPNIENIDTFQGVVIHSRDYRIPGRFKDKRVVVLGSGPSGIDIALEIAQVASETTISMRSPPYPGKLPSKIRQMGPILRAKANHIVFTSGDELPCDVLLFCTGYEYELPFLNLEECGLQIERGKRISKLYRQMINTKYPTMSLIGLPFRVCPFLLFDAQVRYYVSYLQGKVTLSSEEEMNLEIEEEAKRREEAKIPFSRSHQLEELQWEYFNTLGVEAGFSHLLKPYTQTIYDQVGQRRKMNPEDYKNDQVFISGATALVVAAQEVNH